VKLTGIGALTAVASLIGCAHRGGGAGEGQATPPAATEAARTEAPAIPAVVAHSGCIARGALPDPKCTPGAVMTMDLEVICHQSTKVRRHVSAVVHRRAFSDYGLVFPQPRGAFEVDHLIPLELGGDNTIENLWAEAAEPRPGFHEKDRVENYLHEKVCAGEMKVAEAQHLIATDWLSVWSKLESRP
jgi:hypothetical protein